MGILEGEISCDSLFYLRNATIAVSTIKAPPSTTKTAPVMYEASSLYVAVMLF